MCGVGVRVCDLCSCDGDYFFGRSNGIGVGQLSWFRSTVTQRGGGLGIMHLPYYGVYGCSMHHPKPPGRVVLLNSYVGAFKLLPVFVGGTNLRTWVRGRFAHDARTICITQPSELRVWEGL